MILKDHAIVPLGEYKVPLIGIQPDAATQECDLCHDIYALEDIEFSESGQPLCRKCRETKGQNEKPTDH